MFVLDSGEFAIPVHVMQNDNAGHPESARNIAKILEENYPTLRRRVRHHASAVCWELQLPSSDRKDYEQEAYLEIWIKLRYFDSSRGSLLTFIEHVLANRMRSLIRARRRWEQRRDGGVEKLAVEPDYSAFERERDLENISAKLSSEDRRLFELLRRSSPTQVSRHIGVARSTLYSLLFRIRSKLMRQP